MKILFLNHKVERCGVYQYGHRVANIISKSKDVVYVNSILKAHKNQNNYYNRRGDFSLREGRMIEEFGHHAQGLAKDQYEKNQHYNWIHSSWSILKEMPEGINFGYRN